MRDGSFPLVALAKLLAQPPVPCDPAGLSAWFASAFMLFNQLHSVFRALDTSDLLQLFHHRDHVQAYFAAWRRKYPRHAQPFAFIDEELMHDFITMPQATRGLKRAQAASSPAVVASSAASAKKARGAPDGKASGSAARRQAVFGACVEKTLCGQFQFGACAEQGNHVKRNGVSRQITVKHVCVCCAGTHGLNDCFEASAKSLFPA